MTIQELKLIEDLLQIAEDLLLVKSIAPGKVVLSKNRGIHKPESSLIIAKPQYTYQDVKKLAIDKGDLSKYIKDKYGVEEESNNGYCFHHLRNKPHEFGVKRGEGSLAHYERICKTLNDEKFDPVYFGELKDELKNIVFIPIWYHRYLHSNKIKFSNREECYKFLEKMLVSTEKYNEIKALKFDDSSARKALDSVARILMFPGAIPNKDEFIDKLKDMFNEIKQDNINHLSKFVKPENLD